MMSASHSCLVFLARHFCLLVLLFILLVEANSSRSISIPQIQLLQQQQLLSQPVYGINLEPILPGDDASLHLVQIHEDASTIKDMATTGAMYGNWETTNGLSTVDRINKILYYTTDAADIIHAVSLVDGSLLPDLSLNAYVINEIHFDEQSLFISAAFLTGPSSGYIALVQIPTIGKNRSQTLVVNFTSVFPYMNPVHTLVRKGVCYVYFTNFTGSTLEGSVGYFPLDKPEAIHFSPLSCSSTVYPYFMFYDPATGSLVSLGDSQIPGHEFYSAVHIDINTGKCEHTPLNFTGMVNCCDYNPVTRSMFANGGLNGTSYMIEYNFAKKTNTITPVQVNLIELAVLND
eukprot:TRINITY_DN8845_c0_g1_i1.p1 TRINITY_DN8845_c0_g1~~TRINITY_DN8845_c0_g1_i1.p1  ORF type:complete len:346 (-),score=50.92 TRINITY_DN8845_c0_g1_i1:23-1060(-)